MNEVVREEIIESAESSRSEKKSITIGAMVQAGFTLLSRVFGMIRDSMVSHVFGAGAITDAFYVAFTIPNVLRQFFGEGAFSVAFVPIYISVKEKDGVSASRKFFREAFGLLLISLLVITFLGILFSKSLVRMFAYGFSHYQEQFELTNSLTKWLFPYILMVSLVALFGAYLACYKRFAAMAASPILLNVAMIIAMILWTDMCSPPIMVLAVGVLLGGILQVAVMGWVLFRAQLLLWPLFSFKSDGMKRFLKMLGPALFGIFIYQLNIIVLRQLASFLGEGQITYYYNADRLTQFATGVFAVSIATAALPELSRGVHKLNNDAFYDTLRFTLLVTSFIITPCAFGLMVFAYPVISVLFVHGAFNIHDAQITANALMAFSPSVVAFSLSRPVIQAFYALSDTRTPVLVGILVVMLNLGLGLLFLRFDVVGLAMTLSISSFIQFFVLLFLFKLKSGYKFSAGLMRPWCAHAGVSIIACAVGLLVATLGDFDMGLNFRNAVILALLSGLAGTTYFVVAYAFRLPEARKFIDGIKARLIK